MKKFNIQKIKKDIYRITEPYFHEHANLYLIRGRTYDLLIDCGLGVFDIKEFLQEKGFKPRVFLTHSHFDHAGGIGYFKSSEILTTKRILKNLRKQGLLGLKYLRPKFFNKIGLKKLTSKTPQQICSKFAVVVPKGIQPIKTNSIKVGRYTFKIISTPGHTDDSVVLYDSNNKILISGDTLYDGEMYHDLPNSNNIDFKNSLTFIKNLDLKLLLPGHNQILNKNRTKKVIEGWTIKLH